MSRLAIAAAIALAVSGPAFAQSRSHGPAPHELPSTMEFRAANQRMHHAMDIPLSGNADRDFAASMIPHHQGAIDMARIQLRYGRDPDLRRLAQQIIETQEAEIATLRNILARQAPVTR